MSMASLNDMSVTDMDRVQEDEDEHQQQEQSQSEPDLLHRKTMDVANKYQGEMQAFDENEENEDSDEEEN